MGAFVVGVDLNPGPNNPYVLVGDFHHLQFATRSVDVVYTNVIGHVWDLIALGAEVCRVLKPSGEFHMDARSDAAQDDAKFSKATAMIKANRGYQSISFTSGRDLAKRMGLAVTAEPVKNFLVCRCTSRSG